MRRQTPCKLLKLGIPGHRIAWGSSVIPACCDSFLVMSTSTSRQPTEALKLPSAKQPSSLWKRDWYPYYAGFTEAFVNSVAAAYFPASTSVLDPWSGSGTTTSACIKLGLPSRGVDINPALTVIARARLTPIPHSSVLKRNVTKILAGAKAEGPPERQPNDLLSVWIQPRAVCRLRAVQRAIHRKFLSTDVEPHRPSLVFSVDTLPRRVCFYYSALFFAVRNLLATFRTSNPMWLKAPAVIPTSHRTLLDHDIVDIP